MHEAKTAKLREKRKCTFCNQRFHYSLYDKTRRQKTSKDIEDLNEFELIDICRTLQPGTSEYILSSSTFNSNPSKEIKV